MPCPPRSSIASLSRSLSQALVPAAILILILVLYTGFALPQNRMRVFSSDIFGQNVSADQKPLLVRYRLGWIKWVRHLNPIQSVPFLSARVRSRSRRGLAAAVPPSPLGSS